MKRCGERFIVGFEGASVTPAVEEMIVEGRVGGVALFARNMAGLDRTGELCAGLQALRKRVSEIPLVIAVDHEGGTVHRFGGEVTHFPSAMALAATGEPELAERVGYCMGCELRSVGINMNFAPVLDVNMNRNNPVIGVRSFSDDPATVALFGEMMVKGLERAGVAAVAKHFPGLGFAERDAHRELPVIPKERDELEREDLMPFLRAAAAGVSGIMIGHARYPALSARPASLSAAVTGRLLREHCHYEGIAITDDLEMGAVSEQRSVGDAAVKACAAGADFLLICHSRDRQIEGLAAVGDAMRAGKLRSAHLSAGSARLRRFGKMLLARSAATRAEIPESGNLLARRVAESAVTLVSDAEKMLPLRPGGQDELLVLSPGDAALGEIIRARHAMARVLSFGIDPSPDERAIIIREVPASRLIIMGTCDAHLNAGQAQLVREVAAAGKSMVCVALRTPYDVESYPRIAVRIAAYGSDPHTLSAVCRIVFGELQPRGRSPVTLKI